MEKIVGDILQYSEDMDTYPTRDMMYVTVRDTDENLQINTAYGEQIHATYTVSVASHTFGGTPKRTDHPHFWLIATPLLIVTILIFYLLHRSSSGHSICSEKLEKILRGGLTMNNSKRMTLIFIAGLAIGFFAAIPFKQHGAGYGQQEIIDKLMVATIRSIEHEYPQIDIVERESGVGLHVSGDKLPINLVIKFDPPNQAYEKVYDLIKQVHQSACAAFNTDYVQISIFKPEGWEKFNDMQKNMLKEIMSDTRHKKIG